jgi:proline dehydrogenase
MKFLYPLAKRFIAGHDLDSAKRPIQKLLDDGYEVSIDYVGEESLSKKDCLKAFKQYLNIIRCYKKQKIDISIKPTQIGLRLDMEDSSVTTLTRNLAIYLNKRYGNVGVAMQANLYRTWEDVRHLINNNVSIRLVKGAYKGDVENKEELKVIFCELAAHLKFKKANKPAIATHDEEILNEINDDFYDYF